MSRSTNTTTVPIRRGRRICAAALAVTAAAGLPAAVAHASTTAGFKASVPFSGGRSTDLRVGEPLEFSVKGEKISKVCWTPAPIQADSCGSGIAAPAKAGIQRFVVTLKSGKTLHEAVRIGARATTLPASVGDAGAASARVVEYEATCSAKGYRSGPDGHLKGAAPKSANLDKGDFVAAYYKAGSHAVLAMPYKAPIASFYSTSCLKRVK